MSYFRILKHWNHLFFFCFNLTNFHTVHSQFVMVEVDCNVVTRLLIEIFGIGTGDRVLALIEHLVRYFESDVLARCTIKRDHFRCVEAVNTSIRTINILNGTFDQDLSE